MNKFIKSAAVAVALSAVLVTGCKTNAGGKPATFDDMVLISASEKSTGLDYDFEIGKYEVTRNFFRKLMGDAADKSVQYAGTASDGDDRPVEGITKLSAAEFCNALSRYNKITEYYVIEGETVSKSTAENAEYGYRLPTKAEWELCAFAGTTNNYAGTNGTYADKAKDGNLDIEVEVVESDGSVSKVTKTNNIANFGDPLLAEYAWTKYNVLDGTARKEPVPRAVWDASQPNGISGDPGQWGSYITYESTTGDGTVWKSNSYGWSAIRANLADDVFGTRKVGTRKPNEWNLYDMTGNVSEICEDHKGIGGDVTSNTSKLYLGHSSYDPKIIGMRICRTIKPSSGDK